MQVYLRFFLNEVAANTAYRFNTLLRTSSELVVIFVQIAIWTALYGGAAAVVTSYGQVSLSEMTTYVVVSVAVGYFTGVYVIDRIDQRIKSGDIAIDFIRPVSHLLYNLASAWGEKVYSIVVELTPMVILVTVTVGITPPISIGAGLLALAMLPGAALLQFLLSYILGLVGFWHSSVWQLGAYQWMLTSLFSGAFVPLWFFPDWLLSISNYLPFRLLYFAPIATYLGKLGVAEAAWLIAQQWMWVAGLLALQRIVWLAGIRKVVSQGG